MKLTYAFCTYNRSERLPSLVAAMRAQECPVPFEILAVNNNSTDDTAAILEGLAGEPGPSLRVVTETEQGIVPARNRVLNEAMSSDILVFMDDDELPRPGLLQAVYDALVNEGAECVGGRVVVDFRPHSRPDWLTEELLGFLGAVNHGEAPFWIKDAGTPVWSGNAAYAMRLFREDPTLHFDRRYNRQGSDVGGGEDAIMFRTLLDRNLKIRYRPDMVVDHFVEPWRLKRGYFLKLHYRAGVRYGRNELPAYERRIFGVPPFLVTQFLRQCGRMVAMQLREQPGVLRQAMNAAHALGTMAGYREHSVEKNKQHANAISRRAQR